MLHLTYFTAFAVVEARGGFCFQVVLCCMRAKRQWLHAPSGLAFRTRFSSYIPRNLFCSRGKDPAFAQVNSAAVCGFGEVFLHVDLLVTNQFVAVLSYMLAFSLRHL